MARLPVAGPLVIPNAVQVSVYWVCEGRTHSNQYHASRPGTTTVDGTLAQSLFAAISAAFTSSGFAQWIDPAASLAGVGVRDLNVARQVEWRSTGAPVLGTGPLPALPAQVAIVVTHRSALAGREFRGRSYMGCLVVAAAESSFMATDAADTAALAFNNAIRAAFTSAGLTMGIANRALQAGTDKKGNPLPPRAAGMTPITQSVIVNPRLDTQRRRLGR